MSGELLQQIQPVTAAPNGAPSAPPSQPTRAAPAPDDAAKAKQAADAAKAAEASNQAAEAQAAGAQEARKAASEKEKAPLPIRDTRVQVVVDAKGVQQIKVIDAATDKVLLEVPPEELIDFAKRMDEYVGLLFNKVA
jgi:uncharacterized FlaG/YvyC family protein